MAVEGIFASLLPCPSWLKKFTVCLLAPRMSCILSSLVLRQES